MLASVCGVGAICHNRIRRKRSYVREFVVRFVGVRERGTSEGKFSSFVKRVEVVARDVSLVVVRIVLC